ncbi:hypothetical protein [Flavobacterium sp. ACAM 123]|uniref:hypothetical protein n=1 Tax=Flavobacterium sp. ACAM 123 TaxID=1189620 RepID=UPI0002D9D08F|nr:hypothetical protein [Flavobacterium sp. ACAM 123]
MKNFFLSIVVVLSGFSLAAYYHQRNDDLPANRTPIVKISQKIRVEKSIVPIDVAIQSAFFEKYPSLK